MLMAFVRFTESLTKVYLGLAHFLLGGSPLMWMGSAFLLLLLRLEFLSLGYFSLIGAIALIFLLKVRHVTLVLLPAALFQKV